MRGRGRGSSFNHGIAVECWCLKAVTLHFKDATMERNRDMSGDVGHSHGIIGIAISLLVHLFSNSEPIVLNTKMFFYCETLA